MIISFLLVSIIPLCIVAMYSFFSSYFDVKEKVGFYSSQITRQAAGNIDLMLDNVDDLSNRIISSDGVQNDFRIVYTKGELERFKIDDELIKLLTTQLSKNVAFDGISLLHIRGGYEIHVGNKLISKNYIESKLFKDTLADEKNVLWLPPHYNETGANATTKLRKLITYSINIKGKWDGNVMGVLAFSIKPESFSKIFQGMEFWKDGKISIINSEGRYIYSENEALLGDKISDGVLIAQINKFVKEKGNQSFDYTINNTKTLVSCTELVNNNWIVVSMIPYSNLMKKTNNILTFTLWTIVLFLIISVYISLSVAYSISSPLKKLMKAVNKVERGEFEIEVDTSGEDEVKYLNVSYKQAVDKINSLINELYKSKIVQQQTQIKALKAQINPHFLYNTLETISSIAKIKKVREISYIAQDLSAMFRYSIKSGIETVRFSDEIDNVRNYFSILKIRYEEKLDFEFSIEPILYGYKMYKLILQPIVENAVHHGIEQKKGSGMIRVEAFLQNGSIVITISDNGVGIDTKTLESLNEKLQAKDPFMDEKKAGGIGIMNVNARLALYYKDNYQFVINSVFREGTSVKIVIPAEIFEEAQNA